MLQLSSPAREVASLAATIGRSFTFTLLAQATNQDEETLGKSLDELWQRGIVREQGLDAYDFSHDRIREVAYGDISSTRRRLLHRRVAQALEQVYRDNLDEVSAQLAVHYQQTGLFGQAIDHYWQAAQKASQRYANLEAIQFYYNGLSLIPTLPDKPEQVRQELRLQAGLAGMLGYSIGRTPELEHALQRALELCEQAGELSLQAKLLPQLMYYYYGRADFFKAMEVAENALSIAKRQANPVLMLDAHVSKATSLFYLGRLTESLDELEQAIAGFDSYGAMLSAEQYKNSFLASGEGRRARVLWFLGYPAQAVETAEKALALAIKLNVVPRVAYCLFSKARLSLYRCEVSVAYKQAEELIAFAHRYGFPQRVAHGEFLRGWAWAAQGQTDGIVEMERGLAGWLETGTQKHQPDMLITIAAAYGRFGQVAVGLERLTQASVLIERTEERCFEAEMYRVRGELWLRQAGHPVEEVEACFQRALQIARGQQAKSLELRVALSLSRLWQQQGKCKPARALLAGVYGWFTEGFDTPDLQAAQQLLASLSNS